jgi:hypothetical protein
MEDAGGAMGALICVSVLFIGFGLAMIFARDFMWELTHFGNLLGGEKSERTEVWDTGQVISGALLVLLGGGFACWGFSQIQTQMARESNATATAQTQVTLLQETFGSHIIEWQGVDGGRVFYADSTELGIRFQGAYYGRCSSNDFYVYIVNWNDQDYAYVPDNEPERCQPAGMNAYTWSSLGGDWYRVFVRRNHEAIMSSVENANTTATAGAAFWMLVDGFPRMQDWESVESGQVYYATPVRSGNTEHGYMYYGRCESNDLYVYFVNWFISDHDYAYVENSEPERCHPVGMSATTISWLGEDWYSVSVEGELEDIISPTPRATTTFTPRPPTRTPVPTFAALPPDA